MINEANASSSACRLWRVHMVETSTPPVRRYYSALIPTDGQGRPVASPRSKQSARLTPRFLLNHLQIRPRQSLTHSRVAVSDWCMRLLSTSRAVTLVVPLGFAALLGCGTPEPRPAARPTNSASDAQPLVAHARRLLEATDLLGVPLSAADRRALHTAFTETDESKASAAIQRVLDAHCLVNIHINAESRVKAARGPARAELVQHGWRPFLVKVQNDAGTTAELVAISPNARAVWADPWEGSRSIGSPSDKFYSKQAVSAKLTARELWLDLDCYTNQPLAAKLSGANFEYRLLQLYSRDVGQREARLSFNAGQGTQDLGFRSEVDILFHCLPARDITLRVRDEHGKPTTAAFIVRDRFDRTYPSQFKRLAPDFWFHPASLSR